MLSVAYILHDMPTVFDDAKQNEELSEIHKEEEEELVKILSDKYNLPYMDLRGIAPEPDAMQYLNEEEARDAGARRRGVARHRRDGSPSASAHAGQSRLVRGCDAAAKRVSGQGPGTGGSIVTWPKNLGSSAWLELPTV